MIVASRTERIRKIMTNKEAISIIETCDAILWQRLTDEEYKALDMAIEALENYNGYKDDK